MSVPVIVGIALVFSHLAAIPALAYFVYKCLPAETTVLATAVVVSTAYHICQVEWFCFGVVTVKDFQKADHFWVFFALVWFLFYAAGASLDVRASGTVGIMGVSLPVIVSEGNSWLAGAMVVGLGILGFFISLLIYASIRNGILIEWRAFAISLVLLGFGVALHLYAGDFSPENMIYPAAHSIWHILAFVSLYYIAMIPHTKTSFLRDAYWYSKPRQTKGRPRHHVTQRPRNADTHVVSLGGATRLDTSQFDNIYAIPQDL